MPERDANQLAADVTSWCGLSPDGCGDCDVCRLVGLVGTLQQTVRQHRSYADRREGMVVAYDDTGLYVGCIGAETWRWLLERPEMDALALGTLQQERDEWKGNAETAARAADDTEAALTNMTGWHNEAQARVNELEAALAEAQQERHEYGVWAEGKIATTRQALTDGAERAMRYMDTGRGDLDGWADYARALADTGGDTGKKPIPCSCDRRSPNWDARGYCWCGGYDPNRADTGGDTKEPA